MGQSPSYAHIDGKQVCRREKKMTNALSVKTRLKVAAAVALALAVGRGLGADDAHARYKSNPEPCNYAHYCVPPAPF
jgi:hypothetical protein